MARGKNRAARGPGQNNKNLLGFRVYKPKVSKTNREKLKALYSDIVNYILGVVHQLNGSKCLAWYADEWVEMYENAKRMREEAGKRTPPKTPPLLMLVKFIMPDGSIRGNKCAPAVIDLRRGELRIPSYGVVQRLPRSLAKSLTEENKLNPRPDFVLLVTRRGFLRLIASRYVPARVALPLRLICIDENSYNGEALAAWDILKPSEVVLSHYEKLMPRNRGFLDKMAALFKSASKGKAEALEKVRELLRKTGKTEAEVAALLAPEKLAEIAAKTLEREKRLNRAFAEELTARVRALVREARARGWSVAIVVDPIDSESLRGTELQRTLLKPRRLLMNLARYEGALFKLYRASGRMCPQCGAWGVEIAHRRYRCPHCNIEWNRDKAATFMLATRFLDEYFKEECTDETYINITGWLLRHPRGLI
jgi:hypothetical protein